MGDSATTRPSLLVRIRDLQDDEAWSQFVDIYAPLVYGFARKHGLQDADAADLTQDVLRGVARGAGQLAYDRERGTFRGWLFTVARNALCNFLIVQKRQIQGSGDSDVKEMLENQPASEDEAAWDLDYEKRLFTWAAERVRHEFKDSTWQAFWRTAVQGETVKETAQKLKTTVGAVYIARSRVLARLKEEIQSMQYE